MHGSNRLGGNSLSDLLVFGKRAGEYAARYVDELGGRTGRRSPRSDVEAAAATALAAAGRRTRARTRTTLWHDLQTGDAGPGRHHPAQARARGVAQAAGRASRSAVGDRQARPAAASTTRAGTSRWTCATCSSCRSAPPRPRWSGRSRAVATPARTSRRWTRQWRQVNLVCSLDGDDVRIDRTSRCRRCATTC